MHSIKLNIDDKIYDKLLWLLKKFSKDELEIIEENTDPQDHKKYLDSEFKEIIDGNATFHTIDEVEERLDKIIKRHENRL